VDLDGDGALDAVVEDICGAYLIFGIESDAPRSADWSQTLPGNSDAYPFIEIAASASPAETTIAEGWERYVQFFSTDGAASTWTSLGSPSLPQPDWIPDITTLFLPVTGPSGERPGWLVQGSQQFSVASTISQPSADASSAVAWTWSTLKQQPPVPPNLVPFEAYDHLNLLPLAGCPLMAFGVGLFLPNPATAPRRLDMIQFPTDLTVDGEYSVQEIPSDASVVTLSSVVSEQQDTALIGVIGELVGANTFSVYQVSGCNHVELLGEIQFVFDYRTAPTPGLAAGTQIPRTNGVKLLGGRDSLSAPVTFLHYDGYNVWMFNVEQAGSAWNLSQERQVVHAERTDLSVP
jgi:hypothetical protein